MGQARAEGSPLPMMSIPPARAAPAWRQKLCTPSTDVQPPSPAPSPPGYDYYLSTPPDSFSQPAAHQLSVGSGACARHYVCAESSSARCHHPRGNLTIVPSAVRR